MSYPYTSFLDLTFNTYTLTVAAALLLSFVVMIFIQRYVYPPSKVADVCLGALIGGLLFARIEHILIHWSYFADHADEILGFTAGSLNWHGAVIGGLVGAWLVSRWRGIPLAPLMDTFALAIPIIAFGAWRGCEAAACAYGAEVSTLSAYPDFIVWEGSDIYGLIYPRFHTQYLGQMLALALLLLILILRWRRLFVRYHLIMVLALLSIGMLGIGFLRGDSISVPLLDLFTPLFGVIFLYKINLRHRIGDYDE